MVLYELCLKISCGRCILVVLGKVPLMYHETSSKWHSYSSPRAKASTFSIGFLYTFLLYTAIQFSCLLLLSSLFLWTLSHESQASYTTTSITFLSEITQFSHIEKRKICENYLVFLHCWFHDVNPVLR